MKLRQFLQCHFFVQRALICFQKSCLIDMITFSLCIVKKYHTHIFSIFCCLSWHPPALFYRFKGIILMLQNLPKGETDKSYGEKINLRELNFF